MRRALRRARAWWRKTFPKRGRSSSDDLALQQKVGRGPNIDGFGGLR